MRPLNVLFLKFSILFTFMLLTCSMLMAQVMPASPDVGKILSELFTNWSGLGSLGVAMSVIVIVVQLLNWKVLDVYFAKTKKLKAAKKLIVYVLGMSYSVLFLVKSGSPALQSVVGLLTAGGAMALYNLISPLWKKES